MRAVSRVPTYVSLSCEAGPGVGSGPLLWCAGWDGQRRRWWSRDIPPVTGGGLPGRSGPRNGPRTGSEPRGLAAHAGSCDSALWWCFRYEDFLHSLEHLQPNVSTRDERLAISEVVSQSLRRMSRVLRGAAVIVFIFLSDLCAAMCRVANHAKRSFHSRLVSLSGERKYIYILFFMTQLLFDPD